jgi:signal peptidase I
LARLPDCSFRTNAGAVCGSRAERHSARGSAIFADGGDLPSRSGLAFASLGTVAACSAGRLGAIGGIRFGVIPAILVLAIIGCDAGLGREPSDRVRTYRIVSAAMEPTLRAGQEVAVELFPADIEGGGVAKRGDLVMYAWPPDTSKHFIKRVVGIAGDTLSMEDGVLRINGRIVEEPFAWHADTGRAPASSDFRWQRAYVLGDSASYFPSRNDWGPVAVPPDAYFVLGDNRDNSLDSRYWGFLTGHELLGRLELPRSPAH